MSPGCTLFRSVTDRNYIVIVCDVVLTANVRLMKTRGAAACRLVPLRPYGVTILRVYKDENERDQRCDGHRAEQCRAASHANVNSAP